MRRLIRSTKYALKVLENIIGTKDEECLAIIKKAIPKFSESIEIAESEERVPMSAKIAPYVEQLQNIGVYLRTSARVDVLTSSLNNRGEMIVYKQLLYYYFHKRLTLNEVGMMFDRSHSAIKVGVNKIKDLYEIKDKLFLRCLEELNTCLFVLNYPELKI